MLSSKSKIKLTFLHNFNLHKRRELRRIELNDWKKLIGKFQLLFHSFSKTLAGKARGVKSYLVLSF